MKRARGIERPDVAVAVCTRDRPQMLQATLSSLAALNIDDLDVCFIVVENADRLTVGPIVDDFARRVGAERVLSTIEPRLGIAFARNRALEMALEMNARRLAFIDDDEVADAGWLATLITEARRRDLHLVGGPIRLLPTPHDATRGERMVWRGIDARFRGIEGRGRRHVASGRDDRITVTTNNWLTDLDFVDHAGLRFDETLGASGGEDTAFHRALRRAGGRTGWVPDAVIREHWPRERLTLAYQFRRGRDQALARQRARHPRRNAGAVAMALVTASLKALGGVARTLQAPFNGGASLVRAARAFGAAAGGLDYLRGRRSRHYDTTTGR